MECNDQTNDEPQNVMTVNPTFDCVIPYDDITNSVEGPSNVLMKQGSPMSSDTDFSGFDNEIPTINIDDK